MRSTLIFVFAIALIVQGCGQVENTIQGKGAPSTSIAGTWRLSNLSEEASQRTGGDKMLQAAKAKELLQQGILLTFFKDGSFTEVRGTGAYRWGRWRTEKEGQELYMIDATKTDVGSMKLTKKDNRNFLFLTDQEGVEMEFVLSALPLADKQDDPFYAPNNLWRAKPLRKETHDEIEARLANYFKHLALLLKASKEREAAAVSFEFSQGIAKIYNGGIGIHPKSHLADTWKAVFYNDDDANVAYKMFQEYLARASYKGASTGVWVDDDYNILLSIYGDIKSGQFRTGKGTGAGNSLPES